MKERYNNMKYFDYTATTPVDGEVLETYINTTKKFFANTTSLHRLGEESNHMYEVCTKRIKDIIGIKNHKLIYTSNATEANNLAIFGTVLKYEKAKIITTKIEHPSVYNVFKELEDKYEVVYLDVNNEGIIDLKQLEEEMNQDVVLVSVMWVNNIIGSVQPIKDIIEVVKKYKKAHLHVDCVQGMCKVIPDFDFNDIDMFTFSTHKIYGPKGIGGLFVKEGIELNKRLYGSSSQYSIKPGTFDLSLIAATAKCFIKFYNKTSEHFEDVKKKYLYLRTKLENNNKIVFNTNGDKISYYILNFSIIGLRGETIVHTLENEEIYVSTGSSCSSKLVKPEKTILAISSSNERATSTIRISLSFLSTYQEIDCLVNAINKITNGVK